MDFLFDAMGKEERALYTQEDFIQMKEGLDNGRITEQEYGYFYVRYLLNMIRKSVYEKTGISPGHPDYADYISEGVEAVLRHVTKYDPTKTKPGTYFKYHIDERIIEYNTQQGRSSYFNKKINKLDAVAKSHGYAGINDPALSPQALSVYANIPIKTVFEAKSQSEIQLDCFDSLDEEKTKDTRYSTPDAIIIQKEKNAKMNDALSKLTPLERFLVEKDVFERMSMRKILEELKRPENLEKFKGEVRPKMDQFYLRRKLGAGLQTLKREYSSTKPKQNRKSVRVTNVEIDEQATMEDLFNMFSEFENNEETD